MYVGRLGVGIFSFDRPQYLEQLLASLEKNTCQENTDFHIFQDGAINRFSRRKAADPEKIAAAIERSRRARLPNKYYHIRNENVSIGIQQFDAYEWMTRRYDVVLFLEDDIVVSPYYLRVMRVLFESLATVNGVFSASANFRRQTGSADISACLGNMVLAGGHWWGEMFASTQWAAVRPHFLEYYEIIREIDYVQRPRERILALFESRGFHATETSQDRAKDMAVGAAGLSRVRLMVNRALYLGERGLHCTPELYRRDRWHEQTPYVFPEDASIERFTLIVPSHGS